MSSKFQTVIVNKLVVHSVSNWFNDSIKKSITKIVRLREEREKVPTYQYLRKAVFLKKAFQDEHNFLSTLDVTGKKSWDSFDLFIALMILAIYFLWTLPYLVPENLDTIQLFGFQFSSFGFNDTSLLVWFVSRKLIIILTLSYWFITSPQWWRYAILCPLIIYSYQFWEAFQDVNELDSVGNLRVLPLVILNVVLVVIVSRFVKRRSQFMAVYNEISMEVDEIIDEMKSNYPKKVQSALEEIRKTKKGNEYQQKLRALEEEIASKLDLTKG